MLLYCCQCKSFYYGVKACPDCPPQVFGQRKIPPGVSLSEVVSYLEYYGWRLFLYDSRLAVMHHGEGFLPVMGLEVKERSGVLYLEVVVDVCDVLSYSGDGDLMELVMSFNELPGVSRCVFDGEDVYVLITYPLHPGMAVEDFVFALEDEMMLVRVKLEDLGLMEPMLMLMVDGGGGVM